MRSWLSRAAYDHPVTVWMGFLALLVLGTLSWSRVPVSLMPEGFDPNFLWVQVPYPNANPVEVDERIVRPVEDQLSTVPGVARLVSRAENGSAGFQIEFHGSVNMNEAYNTVTDRIERALPDLPEDVERYLVYRYNPSDQPVLWAGVVLPDTTEDPGALLERVVRPALERQPGVASAEVFGVPQRAVYIDYDRESVYAQRVSLGDLQGRLATDNFQIASGELDDGNSVRALRAISRIDDVEQLAEYPVRDEVDLGDIAEVRLREAWSASIWRIDGQEAASLVVRQESSANTVEVSDKVTEALAELESDPRLAGVSFSVFFSQGKLVGESLDTLINTALTGGLFSILVLWLFLREWRMTLLIASCIPFSLLIAVATIDSLGGTLNLISLMGLMLAVGMVVDNAIVVVESIYHRRMAGEDPRQAAVQGSGEVNLAILASTATTLVVFLPMILMSDNAMFAFFMGELGLPVVYALLASLICALVFVPLATRYIGQTKIQPDPRWLERLTEAYAGTLRRVLRYRSDSAMALLAGVVLTLGVAVPNVQCSGMEDSPLNNFVVRFTVPPQYTALERDELVQVFEDLVEEHRDAWGVRVYRASLGDSDRRGNVDVYLNTDGPLDREEVMASVEEALPKDIPGVLANIGWSRGSGSESPSLRIEGENVEQLEEIGQEMIRRFRTVPGVIDAEMEDATESTQELRLTVRREQANKQGVSAQQVGSLVAYALRGTRLPDMRVGAQEVPVQASFSLEDRSTLDAVLDFEVFSPVTMSMLPLRSMADVSYGRGPRRIRREGGQTAVSVVADFEKGVDQREAHRRLASALQGLEVPHGYSWHRGMAFDEQQEDQDATVFALILSICFVFLLMGALFESFILPFAVITAVPMAMVGSVWGLVLTGTPLDTMAGLGLIILVGVVVNNGIVLIDWVTQLRGEGYTTEEALVEAGRRRLRPILMTALTTIFGLVPMAMGTSQFIGIPYAPLGRTVIAGLVVGTVLTLLFVPYLYMILDEWRTTGRLWWSTVRRAKA